MSFKRKRGFLTIAQNNNETDYVRLAYILALSIKATQKENPYLSIMVTPGTKIPKEMRWAFDQVIDIPWGDHAKNSDWKLENEWKVYYATPYEETIKLDADMLFPADYSEWWNVLSQQDMWFTTNVLTFRGAVISNDTFRKTFTLNRLPNVYSGFMYFKQSDLSLEFFKLAEMIYYNWEKFFYEFLIAENRPKIVSTDVVFALATKLLDAEHLVTNKSFHIPTFVHMKSALQGDNIQADWTKSIGLYITPELDIKIGTFRQIYPIHYFLKNIIGNEIVDYYEAAVNDKS